MVTVSSSPDRAGRDRLIQEWMGKTVHVIIDRPVGYHHGDIVYPINYGYIPGLFAGDGEEQDAYILGIAEPLTVFDGQVVGAIRRENDCEDKFIVAPPGMRFHQGEIARAVHFQEQYFVHTIDSMLRKSCGVIPFREWNGEREYLILLQTNDRWSFPKGHMESGETEEETALRELREETGLHSAVLSGQRVETGYVIPPFTRKELILFPARVAGEVTSQQSEILLHRWVRAEELKNYLPPDTWLACKEVVQPSNPHKEEKGCS